MIDALVFSKDRPAQLDLLLRSIEQHAPHLYRTLTVLWTASSMEVVHGYVRCQQLHFGDMTAITWVLESKFEDDVLRWLVDPFASSTVSFLVDDDVFFRSANLSTPLPFSALPYSLRGGDYHYLWSLDGNVYARAWVVDRLEGKTFGNPSQLEACAAEWCDHDVLAHGVPCLAGVPWNRVSATSNMPFRGPSAQELNARFLAGERLALPTIGEAEAAEGWPGPHLLLEPRWEPIPAAV